MKRRKFTAEFKRRVVLEALRGDETVRAIASRHGVHPNQVSKWKTEAHDGLLEVFARPGVLPGSLPFRSVADVWSRLTSSRAISFPMPLPAPVTAITRPAKLNSVALHIIRGDVRKGQHTTCPTSSIPLGFCLLYNKL